MILGAPNTRATLHTTRKVLAAHLWFEAWRPGCFAAQVYLDTKVCRIMAVFWPCLEVLGKLLLSFGVQA